MLKNILKLDGAQKLSKNEQKSISGGLVCQTADICISNCRRSKCNGSYFDSSCCFEY
jgi:hypothetical protein